MKIRSTIKVLLPRPVLKRQFSVGLLSSYNSEVERGALTYDAKQVKILRLLENLQSLITTNSKYAQPTVHSTQPSNESKVFDGNQPIETNQSNKRLKGVYLYGNVGTGKTMLMDKFFFGLNGIEKRRVHFNDFMLEVHSRIHKHKQQLIKEHGRDIHLNLSSGRDSIVIIAQQIAKEAQVLCFDEFQVTDICDAMILARLFNELWKHEVVLIATSNRPPTELYLNGLNRKYFLPFIEQLQVNCVVRNIGSDKDYRSDSVALTDSYFVPNNAPNNLKLQEAFATELENNFAQATVETVPVMMGRSLELKTASLPARCCLVDFADLCETDKGASDYQALCQSFHTIFMKNVPVLTVLTHNEARRFITLIDAMYNANVRFVWTAAAQPAALFVELTAEQVNAGKEAGGSAGASLGADHSWTMPPQLEREVAAPAPSASSSTSNGSSSRGPLPELERNLRGSEQRVLDSNVYFGTSLLVNTSARGSSGGAGSSGEMHQGSTPAGATTAATTGSAGAGGGAAVDAAQEELKLLEGELASVQELSFAFRRAASRLQEMCGEGYLRRWRDMHE
jgi:predicted ATPase